jgi:glycerol-3-phosphate acyltransferase PlsY
MVNIGGGDLFGFKWAAATLLGDVSKTFLSCLVCRYLLFPQLGQIAILYAGLGTALGHGFPFWNRLHGGKGVAVTCTYIVLFSPFFGIAADLTGFVVVLLTGYLAVGALVFPCCFQLFILKYFWARSGLVSLAGTALIFWLPAIR